MEKFRNRTKIEFTGKDDNENIFERQSKITFAGISKSYRTCDRYTFKQNEVCVDQLSYLGLAIIKLSKLLIYDRKYYKLQPYFGEKNVQLHYMDSFLLRLNTTSVIKGLQNL